jgi:hypothetical protein
VFAYLKGHHPLPLSASTSTCIKKVLGHIKKFLVFHQHCHPKFQILGNNIFIFFIYFFYLIKVHWPLKHQHVLPVFNLYTQYKKGLCHPHLKISVSLTKRREQNDTIPFYSESIAKSSTKHLVMGQLFDHQARYCLVELKN